MREAVWGERAMRCPDRGLVGGFAAALLRALRADPSSAGKNRSWAMAALTSYGLKNPADRDEVCLRLTEILDSAPAARRAPADLGAPLERLPGVGTKMAASLAKMGLRTTGDLLGHLPRAYVDRRELVRIGDLRVGQETTVVGRVREMRPSRTRSGRAYVESSVYDGTGYLGLMWWGPQWRTKSLGAGVEAAFSGKVESNRGKLQMVNPAFDVLGRETLRTRRVVPVYPASEDVGSETIMRLVDALLVALGEMPDPLPVRVRVERNLLGAEDAVRQMHAPETPELVPDARRRLVFEELFVLEVALALRKRHLEREVRGIAHTPDGDLVTRWRASLPFIPTAAQDRAMGEIDRDMAQPVPMHRLLQGEVGSGKTLVAVHAALVAAQSGSQAAIMAPTEVLAVQHAKRIRQLVEPVGVDVALLTSAVPAARRRDTLLRLASGEIGIACGTHALISEGVEFRRLGLAVVDEQHRFGLRQRIQLRSKGQDPDVLIMTATPIPRTLALTLYGDLDVSVLDELPAGRLPVRTRVVADDRGRRSAYDLVRSEVNAGRRAYVICALVDESDALEAKAAVAEAERLRTEVFPDLRVGLLHGQMRPADKDRVMQAFRTGEVSVLISTTVVEVGVDVPEATVMLIENAERFGLSQLHQLRGRIGRGEHGGSCVLFSDAQTPDATRRLEAVASTTDGFALAEVDLQIRGEGTIFGTRQAGMVDLKVARLIEDFPVVVEAREAAFALVEGDPHLSSPEHRMLRDEVTRRFADQVDWLFRG